MTVWVLMEEVDIIGVFKDKDEAIKLAVKLDLSNWTIQDFKVKEL
jgi:hypothetical protein